MLSSNMLNERQEKREKEKQKNSDRFETSRKDMHLGKEVRMSGQPETPAVP